MTAESPVGPRKKAAGTKAAEFKYDVAVSFAGEQRDYVKKVVRALEAGGARVFYDMDHEPRLLGEDLATYLTKLYRREARYCAMFVSREYGEKQWTNLERQAAFCRAMEDKGRAFVLPIRFDDTEIPGLLPTIGSIEVKGRLPEEVAQVILDKLDSPDPQESQKASPLPLTVEDANRIAADLCSDIPMVRRRGIASCREHLTIGCTLSIELCQLLVELVVRERMADEDRAGMVELLTSAGHDQAAQRLLDWLLESDPTDDIEVRTSDALGGYFGSTEATLLRFLATVTSRRDRLNLLSPSRTWVILTAFDRAVNRAQLPAEQFLRGMGEICRDLEQHPDHSISERARSLGWNLRTDKA